MMSELMEILAHSNARGLEPGDPILTDTNINLRGRFPLRGTSEAVASDIEGAAARKATPKANGKHTIRVF
jgi:hypothetical protein